MSSYRHTSRRRSPRLDPMGFVTVELFSGRPEVTLIDLSPDGFAVESAEAFAVGTRHHFSFKSANTKDLLASAEVVASLPSEEASRFKTHFKFATADNAMKKAIEQLMDAVTSPLTFY